MKQVNDKQTNITFKMTLGAGVLRAKIPTHPNPTLTDWKGKVDVCHRKDHCFFFLN